MKCCVQVFTLCLSFVAGDLVSSAVMAEEKSSPAKSVFTPEEKAEIGKLIDAKLDPIAADVEELRKFVGYKSPSKTATNPPAPATVAEVSAPAVPKSPPAAATAPAKTAPSGKIVTHAYRGEGQSLPVYEHQVDASGRIKDGTFPKCSVCGSTSCCNADTHRERSPGRLVSARQNQAPDYIPAVTVPQARSTGAAVYFDQFGNLVSGNPVCTGPNCNQGQVCTGPNCNNGQTCTGPGCNQGTPVINYSQPQIFYGR